MPVQSALPEALAGDAVLAAAWSAFAKVHANIAQKLAAMPDTTPQPVTLASGEVVGHTNLAEFAGRFPRLAWSVGVQDPKNGGVGATQSHFVKVNGKQQWAGATTMILPDGLKGFAAHQDRGLVYLALHETAHTTALGLAMNETCWLAHLDDRSQPAWGMSNRWWQRNEKTANNMALLIGSRLGLAVMANPGGGLDTEGDPDAPLFEMLEAIEPPYEGEPGSDGG